MLKPGYVPKQLTRVTGLPPTRTSEMEEIIKEKLLQTIAGLILIAHPKQLESTKILKLILIEFGTNNAIITSTVNIQSCLTF